MLFDHWYAMDLGAYNSRFYDFSSQKQVTLKTKVAWKNKRPFFIEDHRYQDKDVTIKHPLEHSRVLSAFAPIVRQGLYELGQDKSLFQPHALVVTPTHIASKDRQAWHEEFIRAGIQKIDFISVMDVLQTEEPTMLIHCGHSYTELAVYAHGHEYVHKTIYFAGKQVDENIVQSIGKTTNCMVSLEDACLLKEIASRQLWDQKNALLRYTARNVYKEYVQLDIRAIDLWPCMESVIQQITLWAQQCLEQVSVEMKEMIHENGILLSGGMASCFGLPQSIEAALNQPVICTETPDLDVLSNMKGWR